MSHISQGYIAKIKNTRQLMQSNFTKKNNKVLFKPFVRRKLERVTCHKRTNRELRLCTRKAKLTAKLYVIIEVIIALGLLKYGNALLNFF